MRTGDWTYEEDKQLLTWNLPIAEMAKKLNRTKRGVGVRLKALNRNKYTVEMLEKEEMFITETYHHIPLRSIEKYLEIPYQTVRMRVRTLQQQNKLIKIDFVYKNYDDNYLLNNRDKLSLKEMANHLGYTEGKTAVRLELLRQLNPPKETKVDIKIEPMSREIKTHIPSGALIVDEVQSKTKYKKGKRYKVLKTKNEQKVDYVSYLDGTLIEETKDLLVFRDKRGYCESIMKVDLLIKEYKIEEVRK